MKEPTRPSDAVTRLEDRRVISGDNVLLYDTTRRADLRKAHKTGGKYYATHDQPGGPQAHKLTRVTRPADPITAGSDLYIQSIEAGDLLNSYLRPGSGENDLYYEAGDNPVLVHTWTITAFRPVADGEPIQYGDAVILVNKAQTQGSMGCNDGDGYLSVTAPGTDLRSWKISSSERA